MTFFYPFAVKFSLKLKEKEKKNSFRERLKRCSSIKIYIRARKKDREVTA